jgi:hypothetical protein
MGKQTIVDPAGENRGFYGHRSGLRKSLYPAIQFASHGTNLAFLVNLTTGIFYAIADGFLVNIQSDVIHTSFEEPPWLFSESTFPLSSVFVHHALLLDLALGVSVPWLRQPSGRKQPTRTMPVKSGPLGAAVSWILRLCKKGREHSSRPKNEQGSDG